MDFARTILKWYDIHRRDLPWRETRDPYKIWLSEVILQQTRVAQGLPYYQAFTSRFPDVDALAAAREEEVLKLWQGLGYYSRARNLHATAKIVSKEYGGRFPGSYEGLLGLKGIGDYTASAISSFCFGEAQPVVDGNVFRVLSRVFGITEPIDSVKGKKEFRRLAGELMDKKNPGAFNQALMEFGALQCTPRQPGCDTCPFFTGCEARRGNLIEQLPVKAKKTKTRNRYLLYLLLFDGDSVYVRKRTGNDIWKNLHDFPCIETGKKPAEKMIRHPEAFSDAGEFPAAGILSVSGEVRHILSHQKLHIRFVEMKMKKGIVRWKQEGIRKIKTRSLAKLAVPVVIHKYLESRKLI